MAAICFFYTESRFSDNGPARLHTTAKSHENVLEGCNARYLWQESIEQREALKTKQVLSYLSPGPGTEYAIQHFDDCPRC